MTAGTNITTDAGCCCDDPKCKCTCGCSDAPCCGKCSGCTGTCCN